MLTEQVWPCIRVHQRTRPFPRALWKEILAPHRCSVCDTLPHAQLVLGTAHDASVLLPPAAGCCPGSRRQSAPDARRSPPTRHNTQRKSRARAGARPGRLHSASQETRGSFSRPPLRSCWPWTCPGCGDPAGGLFWGLASQGPSRQRLCAPRSQSVAWEHPRAVPGRAARPGSVCHSESEGPAHQGLGGRLLPLAERAASPSAHACPGAACARAPCSVHGTPAPASLPSPRPLPLPVPRLCLFTPAVA